MKLEGAGMLLRMFIGEADRCGQRPLYECLVRSAREQGMAGCTVLRGIEGFGARSVIHTAKILRLSEDLPLVIEIVDTEDKIRAFLPEVDALFERSGCGSCIRGAKRVDGARTPCAPAPKRPMSVTLFPMYLAVSTRLAGRTLGRIAVSILLR
jgi:PII-like signaling protein